MRLQTALENSGKTDQNPKTMAASVYLLCEKSQFPLQLKAKVFISLHFTGQDFSKSNAQPQGLYGAAVRLSLPLKFYSNAGCAERMSVCRACKKELMEMLWSLNQST